MSKIKICNAEYEIVFRPLKDAVFNGCSEIGKCDGINYIIYIAEDMPSNRKIQTLIHELIHALLNEANYSRIIHNKLGEFEEPFVEAMEKPLLSLFIDNDINDIIREIK
jgi:hypothetical protein